MPSNMKFFFFDLIEPSTKTLKQHRKQGQRVRRLKPGLKYYPYYAAIEENISSPANLLAAWLLLLMPSSVLLVKTLSLSVLLSELS